MATSAEFNILPAYTPSHFLCLLCKELWVLGKHSINKCIVRVTLRSWYSNNSSYFQKESAPVCFTGGSRPHYWWAFNSSCTLKLFSFLHFFDFLHLSTSTHMGESWSMPGENSLTLFTLLSAMQILLIWEVLADLSNMIIAPPSITDSLAEFCGFFFSSFLIPQPKTHKVPASIHWGISQTAQDVPHSRCFMAEMYYSYLHILVPWNENWVWFSCFTSHSWKNSCAFKFFYYHQKHDTT